MGKRAEMRQRRRKSRKEHFLPLPECVPQPLKAGGIKVKMLGETNGEERRTGERRGREGTNKVLGRPREKSCL